MPKLWEETIEAHRRAAEVAEEQAGAAAAGAVRGDVAPAELANYCLHALDGATGLPSRAAVDRLVRVTLAGPRPEG